MNRDPEEFYTELGFAIDASNKLSMYLSELKFNEYGNDNEVLNEKLKPILDWNKYLSNKVESLQILLN